MAVCNYPKDESLLYFSSVRYAGESILCKVPAKTVYKQRHNANEQVCYLQMRLWCSWKNIVVKANLFVRFGCRQRPLDFFPSWFSLALFFCNGNGTGIKMYKFIQKLAVETMKSCNEIICMSQSLSKSWQRIWSLRKEDIANLYARGGYTMRA